MSRRSWRARVNRGLARLQQRNAVSNFIAVVVIFVFSNLLIISPASCEDADVLNTTDLSATTATPSVVAAAVAATVDDVDDDDSDDNDVNAERLRLNISPRPDDSGQLVRAVGSSVVFTCQAVSPSDQATTIAWLDKNEIAIPSNTSHSRGMYTESVTSSITKLYISETQNKHAGPYTCVALDQPGRRVAERRVTLLLYRDIEFDAVSGMVAAELGGSVLLPCVVHAHPPPVISWRFGSRRITSGGRYDQRPEGLHISNITSLDEGVYHCQAAVESSGMFNEQPVTLKLLEGPMYSSSERVKQLTGTEGQRLIIVCTATGSPPISYEFFKDGLPVVSSDRVIVNTRSGQLSISTATTNDAGKYLCISSNVVGRVTADRVVDIHSQPVIDELQSVTESRGMTATLLCRSHGHPAPSVTFRRLQPPTDTTYRSGRLYEGGRITVRDVIPGCAELMVRHVTVSDVGVYECQSVNRVGTDVQSATVDVGYEPELMSGGSQWVYGWRREAPTHHNMTCVVDARPAAQLYWTHHHHHHHRHHHHHEHHEHQQQQQQLHSNDTFRVFHVNSSATVLQITIPPADTEANTDWLFGVYTCHASNFFGHNYLSWELRKAEMPCKPRAVRIIKCLTTSVQLAVEMPQDFQGPRVTGFVVHNQLQLIRANLGDEIWLSGLRPSTVYLVNVAAVNVVGVGQSLQFAFTTDNLRGPAAVRSVTVDPSDQSSSNYVVSWQTPHNGGMPIRKYLLRYRQVRRAGRSKTSWPPVSRWTRVLISPTNDADAHSHTVDGLALSSYYELDVRALNALDCSPPFRPPFIFFTYPDRSKSSSWSSEHGVKTYRSAVFVSSSGQRRDVTVTSFCFALAMTSLLYGDTAAVMRLYCVVIFFCGWSILELLVRIRAFTVVAL